MEHIAKNLEDTERIAIEIVESLKGGEVLALQGDLVDGKTTLTQFIAKDLGVTEIVNSPTFVIMKIYDCDNDIIKKLVHIDAYRIKNDQELITIGATEYFGAPNTLTIIEWPENIKRILPQSSIQINITNQDKETRLINVKK